MPECETLSSAVYKPDWLPNAVPYKNAKPLKCLQFSSNASTNGNQFISHVGDINNDIGLNTKCSADQFNRSSVISCSSEKLIYNTDEVSIVNEVKIALLGLNLNNFKFLVPLFFL